MESPQTFDAAYFAPFAVEPLPPLDPSAIPAAHGRPHLQLDIAYVLPLGDDPAAFNRGADSALARQVSTPPPASVPPLEASSSPDHSVSPTSCSPGLFPPTPVSAPSVPASCQDSPSPAGPSKSKSQVHRASPPASPSDDGLVIRGASIAHPYARWYSKKQGAGKRRKMWNHTLEKMLFSAQEISTMGAPQRRTIYTASLEAHIDRLHQQLEACGYPPATKEQLQPYHGLNAKTAKSMVSGLQHDNKEIGVKILELERANARLEQELSSPYRHH